MKKALILICSAGLMGIAFLWAVFLTAKPPAGDQEALLAADQLLAAGYLDEAMAIYEQSADRGQQNSAVYFNLGNAYYQKGDLTAAQNAYEQALALAPRDADVRHNLDLVKQTIDADQPAGTTTLLDNFPFNRISVNELALLSLAAWYAVGFILISFWLFKKGDKQSSTFNS